MSNYCFAWTFNFQAFEISVWISIWKSLCPSFCWVYFFYMYFYNSSTFKIQINSISIDTFFGQMKLELWCTWKRSILHLQVNVELTNHLTLKSGLCPCPIFLLLSWFSELGSLYQSQHLFLKSSSSIFRAGDKQIVLVITKLICWYITYSTHRAI